MKLRTLAPVALAIVLAAVARAEGPLPIGTSLDDVKASLVKMRNVDGRDLSIAEVRGENGTLVIFTCNHCPFVKAWEERTVALGNDAPARGIGVIAINANDPAVQPEDGTEGAFRVSNSALKPRML